MTSSGDGYGSTPPGWYPDHEGITRWWDGTAWTEHTQGAPTTPMPQQDGALAEKKGSGIPKAVWIIAGIVGLLLSLCLIGGLIALVASSDESGDGLSGTTSSSTSASTTSPSESTSETTTESTSSTSTPTSSSSSASETSETSEEPAQESSEDEESGEGSVSQQNALRSAESYIEFSSFSRQGLIDQLKFEGYSTQDATYAVDAVDVDWMEQAARSAKEYLEYSPFSRQGLIDQLEYEGFTPEQARHGVDEAGL